MLMQAASLVLEPLSNISWHFMGASKLYPDMATLFQNDELKLNCFEKLQIALCSLPSLCTNSPSTRRGFYCESTF